MLYQQLKSGHDVQAAGMSIHPRKWLGEYCLFEIRKGQRFTVEYLEDSELFDWTSHLEDVLA